VESSWKGILDLAYDKQEDRILGVNFQGGSIKIWSTDIKTINFNEIHKRNSLSIYKQKSIDKENHLDNDNKKLGLGNLERRKAFIGESQKILHQKNIDINLNKVLDPCKTNHKLRSRTPKDSEILARNKSQNQKSPLTTTRLSYECSSTPRMDQKKGVRTMNLGRLRERLVNHKIDEVSAECETSIMNMQRYCNEELKLSSFMIDHESNARCQQFDMINEVTFKKNKNKYILISYQMNIINFVGLSLRESVI